MASNLESCPSICCSKFLAVLCQAGLSPDGGLVGNDTAIALDVFLQHVEVGGQRPNRGLGTHLHIVRATVLVQAGNAPGFHQALAGRQQMAH